METKNVFRRLSKKMIEDFSISAEISHHGSKGTYRENTLKNFFPKDAFQHAMELAQVK